MILRILTFDYVKKYYIKHHNQREYILIELITYNPNKKSLVTHCHGNLTRRKEEMEWNQAMMSQWSCVFLQSLFSLLFRVSLVFPLVSLLKWPLIIWYDPPQLKWWMTFIISVLIKLASRVCLLVMASWCSFTSGFLPRQLLRT